ncbi:MAG: NAD(P)-dependent oxidoreductase [Alphaproteobacteria bacterium]
MTLVVTGGTGFVLSHLVRQWLEKDPSAEVIVVDRSAPDKAAEVFFRPVRHRIRFIAADIGDWQAWSGAIDPAVVSRVVHGAAVSPIAPDPSVNPDKDNPARTLAINIMGTVRALDWARQLPNLKRFIYLSSGVYGYGHQGQPDDPPEPPITEDEPLQPDAALYDISKATGERLVRRFADLFGLSALSVRPSAIYGPMDRDTGARNVHPVPWHMAHRAVAGQAFRVNSLQGSYDWLYAPDVGRAMVHLLEADAPRHAAYNIGYGERATISDLAEGVRLAAPDFAISEAPAAAADYVQPLHMRGGVWRVRSRARLEDEFGWRPTPHRDAMADYVRWLRDSGAGS